MHKYIYIYDVLARLLRPLAGADDPLDLRVHLLAEHLPLDPHHPPQLVLQRRTVARFAFFRSCECGRVIDGTTCWREFKLGRRSFDGIRVEGG